MSINAFVEVAVSVTNISCIAQVTLTFIKLNIVKPEAIVNQQCLVYKFQCNLCDAGYDLLVTLAATSTNALMDTKKNRRQFVNIILVIIT